MTQEADAEHVPGLAFRPIRGRPQLRQRFELCTLPVRSAHAGLDSQPVTQVQTHQVKDDLEARILLREVDSRQVDQKLHVGVGRVPQKPCHVLPGSRVDNHRVVSVLGVTSYHRSGKLLADQIDQSLRHRSKPRDCYRAQASLDRLSRTTPISGFLTGSKRGLTTPGDRSPR